MKNLYFSLILTAIRNSLTKRPGILTVYVLLGFLFLIVLVGLLATTLVEAVGVDGVGAVAG